MEMTVFLPESKWAKEGYYGIMGIAKLLREHKHNPDAIQFIADMMG